MLIFSSDLFSYQPVLGILETNLSTLALAMETDKDVFKSLKDLTEFYIRSENTGKTVNYIQAAMESHYSDSDIMKNHNGVYVMRVSKPNSQPQMPKVLVWDGRV